MLILWRSCVKMVKDAVECHFDDQDRPKIIRLHFVKEEIIAV